MPSALEEFFKSTYQRPSAPPEEPSLRQAPTGLMGDISKWLGTGPTPEQAAFRDRLGRQLSGIITSTGRGISPMQAGAARIPSRKTALGVEPTTPAAAVVAPTPQRQALNLGTEAATGADITIAPRKADYTPATYNPAYVDLFNKYRKSSAGEDFDPARLASMTEAFEGTFGKYFDTSHLNKLKRKDRELISNLNAAKGQAFNQFLGNMLGYNIESAKGLGATMGGVKGTDVEKYLADIKKSMAPSEIAAGQAEAEYKKTASRVALKGLEDKTKEAKAPYEIFKEGAATLANRYKGMDLNDEGYAKEFDKLVQDLQGSLGGAAPSGDKTGISGRDEWGQLKK